MKAMKSSFLTLPQPFVAGMISQPTIDKCLIAMRTAEHNGAVAFAVGLARQEEAAWTVDGMKRIFHSTGRPCMPYIYRNGNLADKSEDFRAELLLRAAEAGAVGCDVMGDIFNPSPRELTWDKDAMKRQREIIDILKSKGVEVLMSSHMPEALSAQEIVDHLKEQENRGADIAKIVTVANTEEELLEACRATVMAKKELKVPFVQLCNGKFAYLQRYFGPALGSMLTFTVPYYDELNMGTQPITHTAKEIFERILWHQNYEG
ncbi:MAG: type I 3-dehydroquinate dehydratase [Clostridiales bacterium]|nr:type I 3-dehydroquinate dehydratase [Clostridiales bacterium]